MVALVTAIMMGTLTAAPAAASPARSWHYHWRLYFRDGATVRGYSDIVLHNDGSYTFEGHLHNRGSQSYTTTVGWVLTPTTGAAAPVGFGVRAPIAGIRKHGSRDYTWHQSGTKSQIAGLFHSGFTPTGKSSSHQDMPTLLGRDFAKIFWAVNLS